MGFGRWLYNKTDEVLSKATGYDAPKKQSGFNPQYDKGAVKANIQRKLDELHNLETSPERIQELYSHIKYLKSLL